MVIIYERALDVNLDRLEIMLPTTHDSQQPFLIHATVARLCFPRYTQKYFYRYVL